MAKPMTLGEALALRTQASQKQQLTKAAADLIVGFANSNDQLVKSATDRINDAAGLMEKQAGLRDLARRGFKRFGRYALKHPRATAAGVGVASGAGVMAAEKGIQRANEQWYEKRKAEEANKAKSVKMPTKPKPKKPKKAETQEKKAQVRNMIAMLKVAAMLD